MLFKYAGTRTLKLCYSNTEEQQRLNCVIHIQMNSNAGIVLFKYRGTAMLEVCYSNTDEQQRWNCGIQIQMNSNAGIVFLKYRGTAMLHGGVLFQYGGTSMMEVCYSNTDEQQRWKGVIQIQMNSNAGIVLFKYR